MLTSFVTDAKKKKNDIVYINTITAFVCDVMSDKTEAILILCMLKVHAFLCMYEFTCLYNYRQYGL